MHYSIQPPILPPADGPLHVLAICRVTKPEKDDPKARKKLRKDKNKQLSLSDQEKLLREWLKRHYKGPFVLHVIAGTGSGEYLDRKESAEAIAAVESGKYHLVLTEDLGRIFRRVMAYTFCELCEDFGTRLIALNDAGVDTSQESWHGAAFFAVFRHELYNADTAKRIRRTLRSRFQDGGVIQVLPYGYIKPKGCKHDSDVRKDPKAQKIYDEWFRRLEQGQSYSEVADWLNAKGVPVGPGCDLSRWTCQMVRRVTHNEILKGLRVRNKKKSKRINKTGRRKLILASAEERLERFCPHLAFIEPRRYDRLIRKLAARNGHFSRNGDGAGDVMVGRSRFRAWPGHHLECGISGDPFYWGGHGQSDHMMCAGARAHTCWNGITFDGVDAARRLSEAILSEIETMDGFDPVLRRKVEAKFKARYAGTDQELKRCDRELAKVRAQQERVSQGIADGGKGSRTLVQTLMELEAREDQLLARRESLVKQGQQEAFELPSVDDLNALAREAMSGLNSTPEFLRQMRQLVPYLKVFPFRSCDGGRVVLRAKAEINLTALLPEPLQAPEFDKVFKRVIWVDLFEPPQRIRFRSEVVGLRATGLSERQVAKKLGLTVAAAQRAMKLQRIMEQLGLSDPYVPVTAPPKDCPKLRRHKRARYKFKPKPGHPDW